MSSQTTDLSGRGLFWLGFLLGGVNLAAFVLLSLWIWGYYHV